MMYADIRGAIFVLCLMIKHKMKKKLFDNIKVDLFKWCITVLLVVSTLFGHQLKSMVTQDNKVKFVLDSYYNFENSLEHISPAHDSKVGVLKRTSFVKFSFIGLRNEQ
jgi:hypothetical protein